VSFGTILSLLFLLIFIVLPLLSRVMRQGPQAGSGAPGRRPQPPGRPQPRQPGDAAQGQGGTPPWLAEAQRRVREARGEAEPQASTAPPGRPLVPQDPFGPAVRPGDATLVPEDAAAPYVPAGGRTLVPEDAAAPYVPAGGRTLVPGERPGGLVPEDPFERGLVGDASAGQQDATLGREGTPPGRPIGSPQREPRPRRDEAAMRGSGRGAAARSAAAYGRRRQARAGARLGPVDLLRFDRRAIVNGLIWHEILDEPAWKRRRASSRPRSR